MTDDVNIDPPTDPTLTPPTSPAPPASPTRADLQADIVRLLDKADRLRADLEEMKAAMPRWIRWASRLFQGRRR